MKIDFYLTTEQENPPKGALLFTDHYALIMNGQYIEHNGQCYQVTGQTVASEPAAAHMAFITPAPGRPVEINV